MSALATAPLVPVSWGELLDKITILEIKQDRLADVAARRNVGKELHALRRIAAGVGDTTLAGPLKRLRAVNERLWDIEDAIRACEARMDFGPEFIQLARAVYTTNDERAALKRQLNDLLGSELVEEKSYVDYAARPPAHTRAATERPLAGA
jgi:hypothetical protein